jgi:hypothetical protein
MRLDGTIVDTIGHPQDEFPGSTRVEIRDVTPVGTPTVRSARIPFVPDHTARWSPLGYFVTANLRSYAIDLRVPPRESATAGDPRPWRPGDPVASLRRNAPPVPAQAAERADWRQTITMYMRRTASRWSWDGPEIPATKPPIHSLFVATDGRIWVRLSQPARLNPNVLVPSSPTGLGRGGPEVMTRRWVEPEVYDILEPDGRYVGQLRMPTGISPRAVRGNTLWTVLLDTDGVPTVKRFRIQWKR